MNSKLERILRAGTALCFLGAVGLGIFGCSNKKKISEETVFEQKVMEYGGNLNKVVDGVKIDASFSNPRHYTFYGEGRPMGGRLNDNDCLLRVGLWSDIEFPKETTSRAIEYSLNGPYLHEVGFRNAEESFNHNESDKGKRARAEWGLFRTVEQSETRITDYFHEDGKPEAFIVPAIKENKFGAHVFFDEDYIKKNKNPEIGMIYFISGKKKVGEYFSNLGKINLKKVKGVYCGYFEVNDTEMSKHRMTYVIGALKTKDASIEIGNSSERIGLTGNLDCHKMLADILGNNETIMLGFSTKLYD